MADIQVTMLWHLTGSPPKKGRYLVELESTIPFHEVLDYDPDKGGWLPSPLPGRLVGWASPPSISNLPLCLRGAESTTGETK
jgi:hypothetical protein